MSYLSRLEEARRQLVSGDFLAAERHYWAAREEWENSRLRAPVLEKGVEPLLRLGGRLFGRDPDKPVLSTFREREAEILSDLSDVAQLLRRQTIEKSQLSGEQLSAEDVEVLARALLLARDSRIYRLESGEAWPAVRNYLEGAQRHGRSIDVALLPGELALADDDCRWLVQWARGRRRRRGDDARALSGWLVRMLQARALAGGALADDADALALLSQLKLDDPAGAAQALAFGLRSLGQPRPAADAIRLLRVVTGLATNEDRLAVGAIDPSMLHELGESAARLGVSWPPPEIAELLQKRQLREPSQQVALAWSENPRRLLVLRLVGEEPVDVLLIPIAEEEVEATFATGMREARQMVERYVASRASVLTESTPPDWVKGLLGERSCLVLNSIESTLGPARDGQAPRAPRQVHPVFDSEDPLAAGWHPLLQEARWLLPRLLAHAQRECFAPGWGLANLEALGAAGVGAAELFARAIRASGVGSQREIPTLQRVPGPLSLEWPWLWERAREAAAADHLETVEASQDLLILSHPSVSDLAAHAVAHLPTRVYLGDEERALDLASRVSAALDPTRVTVMPSSDVCPENALRLLELWAEESLAKPRRGFEALWLYAELASAPEGDLRGLGPGGDAVRDELHEALDAASSPCRFDAEGSCFREQLEERRRRSLVCVDRLDRLGESQHPIEHLLIDDLLAAAADLPDSQLLALLERVARAWRLAGRATMWLAAPRLGAAIPAALDRVFGERAPLLQGGGVPSGTELGLHCVADGYRPGSLLLERESEALLRGRLRRWADRRGKKSVWQLPGAEMEWPTRDGLSSLRGVAPEPTQVTVVVPRLCGEHFQHELAMLRLASASSWAQAELVVLDPRVHELDGLLEYAPGLREWTPERALVADGRSVLAELPSREIPSWKRPLGEERLRQLASLLQDEAAAERAKELQGLLEPGNDCGRWLFAALRDDERLLLAACIARLARESLDGGPLEIRTVIWLSDSDDDGRRIAAKLGLRHALISGADDEAIEEMLLELEAGRIQWLQLHPNALAQEDIQRFARRVRAALWILPQAERWMAGHPGARQLELAGLDPLMAALGNSSSRCFAFVDDPQRSPATQLLSEHLGLRSRSLAAEELGAAWRLQRRRLADPSIRCPSCGELGALAHARQPCPVCGIARLDRPEPRVLAQAALLDGAVELLGRSGPHVELLLIAESERGARELRRRLGIETADREGLFGAQGGEASYAQRVRTLSELYEGVPAPRRLVLPELPSNALHFRALLWRLLAAGWKGGLVELLDHPVAWDIGRADDPEWGAWGPGALLENLRWNVARSEIEFRVRQTERMPKSPSSSHSFVRRGLGPFEGGELPSSLALGPLLDRLEAAGIAFDDDAEPLSELRLDDFDAAERETLRWFVQEALLEAQPRRVARERGSVHEPAFREQLLDLPYDQEVELPTLAAPVVEEELISRSPRQPATAAWRLGVAASGKTQELLERAEAWKGSRRRLLLLPGAPALLSTAERCVALRPRVELATITELELAFLRHHHRAEGYGRAPRLLPTVLSEEGRRLRAELLRDLSRRYAAVAGSVPPVDIEELQLLIEGRAPRIAASMAEGADSQPVDLGLLEQCAVEARREAGWITPTELRRWSRETLEEHPQIADAWRRRYAALLVDDAHALAPDELAFVEQLFPEEARCFAADPNLLQTRAALARGDALVDSHRLPKEFARAAASLFAREPGQLVAPRGLRRGKGVLEKQRVLNLGACALRIEEDAEAGLHAERRNAIFVSHRGDLEPLSARLRESGLEIWPIDEIARVCVEGPRQLLAALQLIQGLSGDMPAEEMADLAVVLLRAEGLWTEAVDRHLLARRLVSWRHGVSAEATRPAEALLLVLLDLQRQLASVWSLAEAAQKLADSGLLSRLLRGDAVAERLRRFLEQEGERPWRQLPSEIPTQAIAEPLRPGAHLWMLRPEDATGLEFDRVYSICSGLEAHEHHYRALSRAREQLIVLFAERDPFGERP